MTDVGVTTASGRGGRTPVASMRHDQIVSAFIGLVADRGLERVGLADVAAASGVQQAAIRHFVGNRDDLVAAAIDELNRRHLDRSRAVAADSPGIAKLIRLFFQADGYDDPDSRAFAALVAESFHNPDTLAGTRKSCEVLIDVIGEGLRRSYPDAPEARVRDTAYAIACMAESNADLQRMGFPRARCAGAAKAAADLAGQLGPA